MININFVEYNMRLKSFSEKDSQKIAEATKTAEMKTSGEIFTVLTQECDDYHGNVFIVSIIPYLLVTAFIIIFSGTFITVLQGMVWEIEQDSLVFMAVIIPLIFFVVFYVLFSIPMLKYNIISKNRMRKEVRLHAESAFFRHGITATEGATGVLIFISMFERRVELLVDYKIQQKISNDKWEEVVLNIIKGIQSDNFVEVLGAEIIRCGDILSNDFPREMDDVDELDNKPVIE
jgi:putative membrane protein